MPLYKIQSPVRPSSRDLCTPALLAPGTCAPLVLSILNLHDTTKRQSSLESLSLKLLISAQYTNRKRLSLTESKKAIKYPGVTVRKNVKEGRKEGRKEGNEEKR